MPAALFLVVFLAGCSWVPPHPDLPANDVEWRKAVGAMR